MPNKCPICGMEINRKGKTYCSATHRQKAYKSRKDLKEAEK